MNNNQGMSELNTTPVASVPAASPGLQDLNDLDDDLDDNDDDDVPAGGFVSNISAEPSIVSNSSPSKPLVELSDNTPTLGSASVSVDASQPTLTPLNQEVMPNGSPLVSITPESNS